MRLHIIYVKLSLLFNHHSYVNSIRKNNSEIKLFYSSIIVIFQYYYFKLFFIHIISICFSFKHFVENNIRNKIDNHNSLYLYLKAQSIQKFTKYADNI